MWCLTRNGNRLSLGTAVKLWQTGNCPPCASVWLFQSIVVYHKLEGILGQIKMMGVQSLRTVIDRIVMWSQRKYGLVLGVPADIVMMCCVIFLCADTKVCPTSPGIFICPKPIQPCVGAVTTLLMCRHYLKNTAGLGGDEAIFKHT